METKLNPFQAVIDSWFGIVAERSHLYIGYQDTHRRHLYVNAKYCAWFKLTAQDIIGKTLKEIATSPEAYALVEGFETQALAGQIAPFEIKLPEPQGDIVSFIGEFIPHIDPKNGQVLGIISVAHDVTEKEYYAAAIQESEKRYRSLTNTIPQLMWTKKASGELDFINARCLDYTGCTSEDSYKKQWMNFVHPEDLEVITQEWTKSLQQGEPFKAEYRLANHAGDYRWFLGQTVPIKNTDGSISYWIGTATDIEDERCREIELQKAKLQAEDANRAKNAFLANMSHEIRTPLGVILGFSQLLKEDLSATEKSHFTEIIERNGKMLTRIVDDLLDLARIEAGRFVVDIVRFRVGDLISDVFHLFSDKIAEKKLSLTANFDAAPTQEIESDPVRLRQILINLIGNAVKFTDKGKISVTIEEKRTSSGALQLSFVIKDTGRGLTDQQASQLFQPFTQADPSSTREYGGTGLGLALSKRLAEALGGTVELREYAPNKGCTFVASLLTGLPNSKNFTKESLNKKADSNDPLLLKQIKILIVDDSVDNLTLVKHMLTSKGALVDAASSGQEALTLIKNNSYDVAILDIQMPHMDGYQTLAAFREQGFKKPVIACSAHGLKEEQQRTKAAGFADHITKPIHPSELVLSIAHQSRLAFK